MCKRRENTATVLRLSPVGWQQDEANPLILDVFGLIHHEAGEAHIELVPVQVILSEEDIVSSCLLIFFF